MAIVAPNGQGGWVWALSAPTERVAQVGAAKRRIWDRLGQGVAQTKLAAMTAAVEAYNEHREGAVTMRAQDGAQALRSNIEAVTHIDRREPFTNKTGSFLSWRIDIRGAAHAPCAKVVGDRLELLDRDGERFGIVEVGDLPAGYAEELCKAFELSNSVYVVYSYGTVIGWTADPPAGIGAPDRTGVVVPNVRYTETTSKHQHMLMNAATAQWLQFDGAPAAVDVAPRARVYVPGKR